MKYLQHFFSNSRLTLHVNRMVFAQVGPEQQGEQRVESGKRPEATPSSQTAEAVKKAAVMVGGADKNLTELQGGVKNREREARVATIIADWKKALGPLTPRQDQALSQAAEAYVDNENRTVGDVSSAIKNSLNLFFKTVTDKQAFIDDRGTHNWFVKVGDVYIYPRGIDPSTGFLMSTDSTPPPKPES